MSVQIAAEDAADCRHEEKPRSEGGESMGEQVCGPELEWKPRVDQDRHEADEAQDNVDVQPQACPAQSADVLGHADPLNDSVYLGYYRQRESHIT